MLIVETIAKIRRAFFVQGKAIKAICRDLGVSRKVVRKVIRSGATEFRYQREDRKRATNVASRRRPGRDMLRSHSDVGGTTWRQMRSVPIHRGGHDGPRPSGFTLSSAARWPMRMLPTWRVGVGGRSRCR